MIFEKFNMTSFDSEEEKTFLEKLVRSIRLANLLDNKLPDFHSIGFSRRSGEVFSRFRNMVMTLDSVIHDDQEIILLKNLWIPSASRSRGTFRDFLFVLKAFCDANHFGILAVSNPTEADGFDNLELDWKNFRYVKDEARRDRVASFLISNGFIEANPISLVDDFHALLVRIARDYGGLVPKWLAYNLQVEEYDDSLSELAIQKRLQYVQKQLDDDPNQFDSFGYRVKKVTF